MKIIIPTGSEDNLLQCTDRLFASEPELLAGDLIIVSDGVPWQPSLRGATWVAAPSPFNFSGAVNTGMAKAAPHDGLLLADDVWLREPWTPSELRRHLERDEGLALVAPSVRGNCGQPLQRDGRAAGCHSDDAPWLAFICGLISRRAWEAVGPMDERFVGYGMDDVDWCRRAKLAGFRLRICYSVPVEHLERSVYRRADGWRAAYETNRRLYEEKWQGRP